MAAVLLLALAPESAADNAIETVDSYVVVSGDTLWEIAALSTDAGDDVRETIDEINELNGLSSGTLQPGQVLLVPSSD
jgi:LysM repeat protein